MRLKAEEPAAPTRIRQTQHQAAALLAPLGSPASLPPLPPLLTVEGDAVLPMVLVLLHHALGLAPRLVARLPQRLEGRRAVQPREALHAAADTKRPPTSTTHQHNHQATAALDASEQAPSTALIIHDRCPSSATACCGLERSSLPAYLLGQALQQLVASERAVPILVERIEDAPDDAAISRSRGPIPPPMMRSLVMTGEVCLSACLFPAR